MFEIIRNNPWSTAIVVIAAIFLIAAVVGMAAMNDDGVDVTFGLGGKVSEGFAWFIIGLSAACCFAFPLGTAAINLDDKVQRGRYILAGFTGHMVRDDWSIERIDRAVMAEYGGTYDEVSERPLDYPKLVAKIEEKSN